MSLQTYIQLMRPKHWVKNLFLFSAPLFGGVLFLPHNLGPALLAFGSFSLCASSIYIMNDIIDKESDLFHPIKKYRPIASNRIPVETASVSSLFIFLGSLLLGINISLIFVSILLLYGGTQIFYTFFGKHIFALDILLVSSGFILRMIAGAIAFDTIVSPWLFICLFTLSVILATGKRLSECYLLGEIASQHRLTLGCYSVRRLRGIMVAASAASCLFYFLYVIEHSNFLITMPFVWGGVVRYLRLVAKGYGDPIVAVLQDRLLALIVILWLCLVVLIQYGPMISLFSMPAMSQLLGLRMLP